MVPLTRRGPNLPAFRLWVAWMHSPPPPGQWEGHPTTDPLVPFQSAELGEGGCGAWADTPPPPPSPHPCLGSGSRSRTDSDHRLSDLQSTTLPLCYAASCLLWNTQTGWGNFSRIISIRVPSPLAEPRAQVYRDQTNYKCTFPANSGKKSLDLLPVSAYHEHGIRKHGNVSILASFLCHLSNIQILLSICEC